MTVVQSLQQCRFYNGKNKNIFLFHENTMRSETSLVTVHTWEGGTRVLE